MTLELVLAIMGAIGSVVIPFIINGLKNQNEKLRVMEDRIYQMRGETVSKSQLKEELRELENRFSININEKLDNVRLEISSLKELLLLLVKKEKE